ncbi:ABC transporter family substrate-binding protein [Streptomyces fragilis]|uniref:ABC transporter family substrate-binding protein n=1 Tax=Streptomyces fragilis TaxID=67301 RepID=A0ABV2YR97_9ACTN|nr:ABC transporter family substrate-binding protein [Streptomyces fragilis]
MRSVVFLTAGLLAVTALSGCGSGEQASEPLAGPDIAPATRERIKDGGTLRWAVDSVPQTLNTFQSDADATTTRVAQAVLPAMFRLDSRGRPQRAAEFLESAEVVGTEPKQVVLYKLDRAAVWSDGRKIGAADFAAQWHALSGRNSAFWTAHNAGYDRIERVQRGTNDQEVKVTFARRYADWRSLFSPLYPKDVMGTAEAFNNGARKALRVTAGPFTVKEVDRKAGDVTLERNERWWGEPAKLDRIELRAVPRGKRTAELAAGRLDLAEVDGPQARRIGSAAPGPKGTPAPGGSARALGGPGAAKAATPALLTGAPGAGAAGTVAAAAATLSWAALHGSDAKAAAAEGAARAKRAEAEKRFAAEQQGLGRYTVRKSLEPAYTQLALNGSQGPLADERVRRAVARALDREELARTVLGPLGLPTEPVGSHVALAGQSYYADGSGALGDHDTEKALSLLAEAGWKAGGPVREPAAGVAGAGGNGPGGKSATSPSPAGSPPAGTGDSTGSPTAGAPTPSASAAASSASPASSESSQTPESSESASVAEEDDGDATYVVGEDGKPARDAREQQGGGMPGAYAPRGTAAPAGAETAQLAKDGRPLSLRFVLPSGPGSESLRAVGDRVQRMLRQVGIRVEITRVPDEGYFKDHVANGQYDLALYSWPVSAYPATDARPIFAKPVPAADGSLVVEQNYTRVGTDEVDQLFDRAVSELDEEEGRELMRRADERIWTAAGSVPLYQRPQLVAVRRTVANAGAFGFGTPVYEDMGFLKK